jgi:hypothetical protein
MVSFMLSHFIPNEIVPGNHWTGSWVGLRASLDAVEKILASAGNQTPTIQLIAHHYTN